MFSIFFRWSWKAIYMSGLRNVDTRRVMLKSFAVFSHGKRDSIWHPFHHTLPKCNTCSVWFTFWCMATKEVVLFCTVLCTVIPCVQCTIYPCKVSYIIPVQCTVIYCTVHCCPLNSQQTVSFIPSSGYWYPLYTALLSTVSWIVISCTVHCYPLYCKLHSYLQ